MDYEILKEENGLRVKLVQDVYAEVRRVRLQVGRQQEHVARPRPMPQQDGALPQG